MCRKIISGAERSAGWRDINDAIMVVRNVFDMAAHDARDKNSRNKVLKLLCTAQEIAVAESAYSQMAEYNGCFIPSLRKIFSRSKI